MIAMESDESPMNLRWISDESPMDLRRISLGCLVLTLPSSQSLRKIIFVEELIAS
jgi:3-methyladenine DNA glycosylase AlkC